jgi:beta-lactamase regulating signal transducer with metallopeptidase domain
MNNLITPTGELLAHWILAWSVVVAAAVGAVAVGRLRRPALRYACWLTATFAGVVLAPIVVCVSPAVDWRSLVDRMRASESAPLAASERFESWFKLSEELAGAPSLPAQIAAPPAARTANVANAPMATPPLSARPTGAPLATTLALAWAAGVGYRGLRLAVSMRRAQRLLRESNSSFDERLQDEFSAATGAVGLRRPVRLVIHAELATPVCIGGRRPAVLWPARDGEVIAADERRSALVHELAHLARYDDAVNLAAEAWRALAWPFLPIHWLVGQLRREQEFLSDDAAARAMERPHAYARMLLGLTPVNVRVGSMCTAFIGAGMPGRVRRLLDKRWKAAALPSRRQMLSMGALAAVLIATAGSVRLIGLAAEPATADAPDSELPDMTPAEIGEKLAAALKNYERGLIEVEFQDERDVNALGNRDAGQLLKRWPGRFRYASDGHRWRGEFESMRYSSNSEELSPYGWSAGFDGEAHFNWQMSDDAIYIGEQVAHENIPLPGFFWSSHGEGFPKSLTENGWKVERQVTVGGYRCYFLVHEQPVNDHVWRFELTLSPRQGWLPIRYIVTGDGQLIWTHELFDLAQSGAGNWYPQRLQKIDAYFSGKYEARVTRYDPAPRLDDAYFRMEIPPGVGVCDYRNGRQYRNDPWWPEIEPLVQARFGWPPTDLRRLVEMGSDVDSAVDGQPAPALAVDEWIQAGPVEIERLRGKVVLLYFTAGSFWSPDPQWTAALKGLYDLYHPLGLEVVEINAHVDDVTQVQQRVEELWIPWPVAVDAASTGSAHGKTFSSYRLKTHISPVFVDHEGKVKLAPPGKLAETAASLLRAAGVENVPTINLDFVDIPRNMPGEVQGAWNRLLQNAPRSARIAGRVTDAAGALADVEIDGRLRFELNISAGTTSATHLIYANEQFSARTNADGQFELSGLPNGVYLLKFHLPGRAYVERRVVVPSADSDATIEFDMSQLDGIEGRVVTKAGEPLAGAEVRILYRHHLIERDHPRTTSADQPPPATTDGEGRFKIENLQTGAYTLEISHEGFAAGELKRIPAGTRDAVVTLSKP